MKDYASSLFAAITFTKSQGYSLDRDPTDASFDATRIACVDITSLIQDVFAVEAIKQSKLGPVAEYGIQCANVHLAALRYLIQHHSELSPNITIGAFQYAGAQLSPFTRQDFKQFLGIKPKRSKFHVWITFGSDVILDLTGPTYVNAHHFGNPTLGGAAFGRQGGLENLELPVASFSQEKLDLHPLSYQPIAVGLRALTAIAPLHGV